MARIISKVKPLPPEPTITLELTQTELRTLWAGFGVTNDVNRKRMADQYGVPILSGSAGDEFYDFMKREALEGRM